MSTEFSNPAVVANKYESKRLSEWMAYSHAISEWCLRNARKRIEQGSVEDSLMWNTLAAEALGFGCDPLGSVEVEENLLRIAQKLPLYKWSGAGTARAPKRWLHVMDSALPYGGHTAMVSRWIANDPGTNIHSVALLGQKRPVPESLRQAVERSGGNITLAARGDGALLFSRAAWLRKLAYETADCVVLHVANSNVMAPVAFGVDGGPPILFLNHSAHRFWIGGSISDLVLNCRGSQLETEWTVSYRGIPRCATLPIPIPSPEKHDAHDIFSEAERTEARQDLALPPGAIVLLTVGTQFKYNPLPRFSFFDAAQSILSSSPKAHLLVIGPSENKDWKALSESARGRVRILGVQRDLRRYYAAADVYLEGFPFGSATALLEAGVHGIPTVLAPCPPPFGTDGIALEDIVIRPDNVGRYVETAINLIENSDERVRQAHAVAESIAEHHIGTKWANYLSRVIEQIPPVHSVSMPKPKSPPRPTVDYWTNFVSTWPEPIGRYRGDLLEHPFRLALRFGVTPVIDRPLYEACRAAKQVRKEAGAPLSLYMLFSILVRVFPSSVVRPLYGTLVTIFRANGKVRRTLRSFYQLRGLASEARKGIPPYDKPDHLHL